MNTRAHKTNLDCRCKTLDWEELHKVLDQNKEWRVFSKGNNYFSDTSVYLSPNEILKMREIISEIENVVKLAGYKNSVFEESPAISKINFGPKGVFMGYDFHLSEDGPKIIEVNTNAGGAYLNLLLAQAQIQCCPGIEPATDLGKLEEKFIEMFKNEWKRQRREEELKTIAIVDEKPQEQFLFSEFKLFQELFQRHGIDCLIADPADLIHKDSGLHLASQRIDLVYNRLTDFYLSAPESEQLKKAYENGDVVITPNPHHHALYARKSNLELLSDLEKLIAFGVGPEARKTLCQGIPRTIRVTAENQTALWVNKKNYFFKPISGFGSRATYRGDKLTQRVWAEIVRGDYVAQDFVKAPLRSVSSDGLAQQLKFDIRAYTYDGEVLLIAARLYSGQTTNFRTLGGGFAPVNILE